MLIERLRDGDPRQQEAATDTLVGAGAAAVGPLLTALCAEDSWVAERTYGDVLRRIGDAAFWPLVDAIATAESWSQVVSAGTVLEGLQVSDPAMYLEALRHPSAAVRNRTLCVFQAMGEQALPYAAELLTYVGDPDENVQGRALEALRAMGPGAVPVLRRIRRSASRSRRLALTALADGWGWAGLDATDRAVVRRLIDVKRIHEVPESMALCGRWYAVRTSDQAAVLEAFGLSDPVPVTMRLGEAAWHNDHHNFHAEGGTHGYVTPVLDGWTLVFGEPSADAPLALAEDDGNAMAVALSRRFGAAHWYMTFEGCTGWCLAEDGQIVRYYDNEKPENQIGPPHPAERDHLREPDEDERAEFEAESSPGVLISDAWATDVAGAASVDPEALGPHTQVTGHGVLALTAAGRRNPNPPPCALPI